MEFVDLRKAIKVKNSPWKVSTEAMPIVADTIAMSENGRRPRIMVDGKFQEEGFDINTISPIQIESMNIIKSRKEAVEKYGEKGKNGVIEVFTKAYREKHPEMEYRMHVEDQSSTKTSSDNKLTNKYTQTPWKVEAGVKPIDGKQPRIVVNGEMKEEGFDINTLDLSKIGGTSVWKGEKAIEKYGEKGVNGVVEITIIKEE